MNFMMSLFGKHVISPLRCLTFSGFLALNPAERQIPFEVQKSPIVDGLGLLEHSQSNTPEAMKQALRTLSIIPFSGDFRWHEAVW